VTPAFRWFQVQYVGFSACGKGKKVLMYNLLNLKRYRFEGGIGTDDWLGKPAPTSSTRSRLTSSTTGPAWGSTVPGF
jgi:hypothetical protein